MSAEHNQHIAEKRILIMTAVQAERDAVCRGLQTAPGFEVRLAGVGPIAAAANTAAVLAAGGYSLVISAGIGGGFAGRAAIGTLVVSTGLVGADLGAQSPEGFISLDELGFGSSRIEPDRRAAERLAEGLRLAGLAVCTGDILTVSTATGTAAGAAELLGRVPGAAAEGMEGFGVATAAQACGVPVLELRAISNAVGPRNRAAWRIGDALKALEEASKVLVEVSQ